MRESKKIFLGLFILVSVSLLLAQQAKTGDAATTEIQFRKMMDAAQKSRVSGNLDEARDKLVNAMKIANKMQSITGVRDAHLGLSNIYEALNDFKMALHHREEYKSIDDLIINETSRQNLKKMQVQQRILLKEKELHRLKQEKEIYELELERQIHHKKIFIMAFVLFLMLSFLAFNRYHLKKKIARVYRKKIRQNRHAEEEKLKRKKLEAIGVLAGGIAHDFNDMLSVVIGNISLAREGLKDEPEAFKMLGIAEKASHQVAELSQRLITFSRGGWLLCRRVSFASLINSTGYYYPQMEQFLKDCDIARNLQAIYGDDRQLRQVLHNVVQNAIEATENENDGFIHISAENITLEKNNDFALKDGDYIKISIADNGCGISATHLPNVFDPYFSTKHSYYQKGMGLGLATSYSIINKHKGDILIQSHEGEGTTVIIYLPAFEKETHHSRALS